MAAYRLPLWWAYKLNLPLVLVRDKVKDHGIKKIIDGYMPTKKDLVCIIDDVYTTGSSIEDTKDKLSATKARFSKPVVVLNRSIKNNVIALLGVSEVLKFSRG